MIFHVSPAIGPETRHALEEMAAVIARNHGHTGPVDVAFTETRGPAWCGVEDDYVEEPEEDCEFCGEWNRCTCYDDTDDPETADDIADYLENPNERSDV